MAKRWVLRRQPSYDMNTERRDAAGGGYLRCGTVTARDLIKPLIVRTADRRARPAFN